DTAENRRIRHAWANRDKWPSRHGTAPVRTGAPGVDTPGVATPGVATLIGMMADSARRLSRAISFPNVMSIVNIASYRFVGLDDLPQLRERILAQALADELRGTVLLAPEGINLFLAGTADNIRTFLTWLEQDPRLAGLEVKYSHSQTVPFRRMLV